MLCCVWVLFLRCEFHVGFSVVNIRFTMSCYCLLFGVRVGGVRHFCWRLTVMCGNWLQKMGYKNIFVHHLVVWLNSSGRILRVTTFTYTNHIHNVISSFGKWDQICDRSVCHRFSYQIKGLWVVIHIACTSTITGFVGSIRRSVERLRSRATRRSASVPDNLNILDDSDDFGFRPASAGPDGECP